MAEWFKNAILYQIYPQSFMDSNGDGIGDFKGIQQKLDYIKELGATAIWLNPCFVSPFGDAGYDVADYYNVAPRYGTNDDLKELCDEVHNRGMHIILDLVPGHTSIEHPWFRESCRPGKNENTDRYIWTDSVWKDIKAAGITGSLRGISDRDGCCGVNFFSHQPALNYGFYNIEETWQQSYEAEGPTKNRQELLNIMRFWLKLGCDGFRVDMAGSLVKNDPDKKGTIRLWNEIFAVIKGEYPNAAFVAEWFEPERAFRAGFTGDFAAWYVDFVRSDPSYFDHLGGGDASKGMELYLEDSKRNENEHYLCFHIGNHDVRRINSLSEGEPQLVYGLAMTLKAVPFMYYGDEIGMRFATEYPSHEGSYSTRTGSRTPMQWTNGKNAGFSTADEDKLYLPVDKGENIPCVSLQENDENSMLNYVKSLIRLRNSHKALSIGADMELVFAEKYQYPLVYKRFTDDEELVIVINAINRETTLNMEINGEIIFTYGGNVKSEKGRLTIPPVSFNVIKVK